jgi:hypothetical protein
VIDFEMLNLNFFFELVGKPEVDEQVLSKQLENSGIKDASSLRQLGPFLIFLSVVLLIFLLANIMIVACK